MNKKILIGIGVVVVVIIVVSFVRYYEDNFYYEEEYLQNISYDVPREFEKSEYGEYYHYYGDDVSCHFEVMDFSTYSSKSGKEYLENYVSVHLSDEVSDVKEVDLNGDMWYYFSSKNRGNISYYYAIVKEDKGYYLEYTIRDDKNGDYGNGENNFCKVSYGEIISSVTLK